MSNVDDGASAAAGANGPQFTILAQFVKDLSFENPNVLQLMRGQRPELDVGVDVQARGAAQDQYEVVLKISINSKPGQPGFVVELEYGGIFGLRNVPAEALQPLLLIECPRLLFPFARRIIADVTRDGALPPLMMDPIDFSALYRQQLARAQTQPVGQA
jgi:preprotein translocase subunit SecB